VGLVYRNSAAYEQIPPLTGAITQDKQRMAYFDSRVIDT
jgi:hypothetical protein